MIPLETIERDTLTARIYQDEDPYDPRENDNLSVLVCWHRGYKLGDRQPEDAELTALRHGGWPGLEKHLKRQYGALLVVPLSLLDHSGLHMWVGGGPHWSDTAGWDSGTVGFAYITAKRMVELCGAPDYKPADFPGTITQWLEQQIAAEVHEYDQYLRGDVYGIVIEDENGEAVDSCWGFYGSDFALGEAERMLDDCEGVNRE